jgi:hypothetical protein
MGGPHDTSGGGKSEALDAFPNYPRIAMLGVRTSKYTLHANLYSNLWVELARWKTRPKAI